MFDAQYKGNSTTESIGDPVTAELVWQDAKNLIQDIYYVSKEKKIVAVTAPGTSGNAVVAACGADGEILWSWHLWIADYDPAASLYTTPANASGTTWTFMDRNVGATTNAPDSFDCHGMIYQWGRKDPIPNSDVYYVDGVATNIASSYPVWQPATLTEATIAASVLRPGYIINKPAAGDCSSWLGEDNRLLWGDSSQKTVTDGGWTDVKTIYDPSPVGYRVANSATFTRFITPDRTDIQMKGVTGFRTIDGVTVPNLTYDYIQCIVSTEMSGTTERWLPKGIHRNRIGFACNTSDNLSLIHI